MCAAQRRSVSLSLSSLCAASRSRSALAWSDERVCGDAEMERSGHRDEAKRNDKKGNENTELIITYICLFTW